MKVFNSLSGQKEEITPQGDEVKMYVCGINPYADSHIGHIGREHYLAMTIYRKPSRTCAAVAGNNGCGSAASSQDEC